MPVCNGDSVSRQDHSSNRMQALLTKKTRPNITDEEVYSILLAFGKNGAFSNEVFRLHARLHSIFPQVSKAHLVTSRRDALQGGVKTVVYDGISLK